MLATAKDKEDKDESWYEDKNSSPWKKRRWTGAAFTSPSVARAWGLVWHSLKRFSYSTSLYVMLVYVGICWYMLVYVDICWFGIWYSLLMFRLLA